MCNEQRFSRYGGFAVAGYLAAVLAVGVACAEPAPATEPSNDAQQPATGVITRSENPDVVLRALIAVLVRRDEIAADVGQRLLAQDTESRLEVTGRSVDLERDQLVALVPTESAKFVTGGGRYVVGAILEPRPGGGTRLTFRPVLVATGGGGPLGGRPLPSNGTLERQLLDELNTELAKAR